MKNSLSVLFLLFASLCSPAQISIQSADMPQVGDTIRQSTTVDLGTINYLEAGAGVNWDFMSLIPFTQKVDTFVSFSSTPWLYQLVFFGSANLAQPLLEFDQFPGFEVSDAFNYYNNTNSAYSLAGNAATLNGIPLPNKFNNPDVIYHFPLAYGNADSSYSTYSFDVPGLGYLGGWKNRVNHADGWGTLSTPYGTFDVLRVKSDIVQYDSIYLDSLGFGFPTVREYTEYKWLSSGMGLPLVTVTDDGLLPTVTYIDSVRNIISGVPEINAMQNIKIYPNPFKNNLSIYSAAGIDRRDGIDVMGIEGQLVQSIPLNDIPSQQNTFQLWLNGDLPAGVYFLKMSIDHKIVLKKIVKF